MGKELKRTFLAALIVVVALIGCGDKTAPSFERPPAPVTATAAISRDVPVYIDAVGKTVAQETVSIHPQLSGRITAIAFPDGADLKKGQILFTVDPRPFEAALHQAEANLAQKKAEADLAETELKRAEDLVKKDFISQQDYDSKKNAAIVSKTQIQQSQAALETAKLNLDYCSIHSPIDGRASHRLIDIGNVVKPEDTLIVIERLDPIYADFTVTENDLSSVQQNLANGLKAQVRLPDEPDGREGDLSFIDNAVQEGTGTVKLRATIPNTDRHFWPGRFVNVRLVLTTLRKAVLVPVTATQMSANGPFVYVVKQDSTAELRPVKVGQRQGDLVVITQGVQPGEKIVTNGQIGVTPGGKLRVQEVAPALGSEGEPKLAAEGGKS
jgi:multidrug efflux system membrane fusion protein